jgi:hypothetical protein
VAAAVILLTITLFFVLLYWYMTMTGEDISQSTASSNQSFLATIVNTYRYLPRIGELYQSLTIRFYEPIARLNHCLLPRVADSGLALTFLYFAAWLSLRRRPKLDAESAVAVALIFIILILSPANNIFASRFSCLHNYVLGYLLPILFCIPFAIAFSSDADRNSKGAAIGCFVLGLFTGYSTEVSPMLLLLILSFVCIARYKTITIFPSWMICGLGGLFIGIILFHSTGGLNSRINGPYASAYEYVFSPTNFAGGINKIFYQLFSHFAYNIKPLWLWLFCCLIVLLFYFVQSIKARLSANRGAWMTRGYFLSAFLAFSFAYLAISSVIRVDDELYGRYMAGIYISFAIAAAQFANALLFDVFKIRDAQSVGIMSLLAAFIVLINADMIYAFSLYNKKGNEIVSQLQRQRSPRFYEPDLEMAGSPIFGIRQYPILEPWANPTAFGAEIQYFGDGRSEAADATKNSGPMAR